MTPRRIGLAAAGFALAFVLAVCAVSLATFETARAARVHASTLNHGLTFTVVCDTTSAGVVVQEASPVFPPWSSVYCENNSSTTAFWGFGQSSTAFDTTLSPCISTTGATCLSPWFSIDAQRGAIRCKSASSVTLKCNAGGP